MADTGPTTSADVRLARLLTMKRIFVILLVAYVPGMVGLGLVLGHLGRSDMVPRVLDWVAALWLGGLFSLWMVVASRRCPRCGRFFSWKGLFGVRPFRLRCAHCQATGHAGAGSDTATPNHQDSGP